MPAQLYAMGLIDEASHVLMARYREQFDPEVMTGALDWFAAQVGAEALDKLLLTFVEQFPGSTVIAARRRRASGWQGRPTACRTAPPRWKRCCCCGRPTATRPSSPLRSCSKTRPLAEKTVYRQVTRQLPEYFATRPLIPLPDAKPMNLLDLLRAPAVGSPRSLSDSWP